MLLDGSPLDVRTPSRAARRLARVLQLAYDEVAARYPTMAACNIAARRVAELLGEDGAVGDLAGLANQQAATLAASPRWRRVTEAEAQRSADQGGLVVGAWSNPAGPGHSVVVSPRVARAPQGRVSRSPWVMSCGAPGTDARRPRVRSARVYASADGAPSWYALRPAEPAAGGAR